MRVYIKNNAACLKVRYLGKTKCSPKVFLSFPVCVIGKCFFQRRIRSHGVLEMVFSINLFFTEDFVPITSALPVQLFCTFQCDKAHILYLSISSSLRICLIGGTLNLQESSNYLSNEYNNYHFKAFKIV